MIESQYSLFLKQLDNNTEEHSHSVGKMCRDIAPHIGLDPNIAYKIGLIHDLGKIYIPARILKKNGKLTELEREIIDLHSYYGYRVLKFKNEEDVVALPVLYHHGYDKIKPAPVIHEPLTDEIKLYTSLVHSVDVYDAMVSARPYHSSFDIESILNELHKDEMCTAEILLRIEEEDCKIKRQVV